MKYLYHIILLISSILNLIPYQVFFNPIVFDRSIDNFLISKLLNNEENNNKNEILAQLELIEISQDDYDFLLELEKKVFVVATKDSIVKWKELETSNRYATYEELSKNFKNKKDFLTSSEFGQNNINLRKFEKTLLKIYNFLFNFLSEEELSYINLGIYIGEAHKMFKNEREDIMDDTLAMTVSNVFNDDKFYSCIYLNADIYEKMEIYKTSYENGYFSTNLEEYGSLIHEYGHVLSSFLYATNSRQYKNNYNKNIAKNCNQLRETEKAERPHIYFTDEFNFKFTEILLKKIIGDNFNKMTSVRRKLALWTALPSIYARSNNLANRQNFELEYFAEAFSYWLVTPDSLKNYYWELIDSSFRELLKKQTWRRENINA